MRVLYFSRGFTTHDYRFLSVLGDTHHEIYFLQLEDDAIPTEKRPLPGGVAAVRWRGRTTRADQPAQLIERMPEFEEILHTIRPSLVHAGPIPSCAFMTALAGFHPLLAMSWGSDLLVDADRDPHWRWRTSYSLLRADWLLCDCEAVRQKAESLATFPDDRIIQFPWGIDLASFTQRGLESIRRLLPEAWNNSIVVLSTRSWEPVYGIEVLLDAFREARRQEPRLRLILLGSGTLSGAIQDQIDRNELIDVVHRPGVVSQDEIPAFFAAADIYLSCAYSDGASISLLEAMATGKQVVVTDCPGNREWIKQDENGWLVQPGDSDAFASALVAAANTDANERLRIATANRRVVDARADWSRNSSVLLAAYDQIERSNVHAVD